MKDVWKLILQLHAEPAGNPAGGGDGGNGGGGPAAGNAGGGDPAGNGADGAGDGGQPGAGNPPDGGFKQNPFGSEKPEQKPEQKPAPVIPDKYEFKLAEGLEIAPAVAEEFTGIAKELGLSQAGVDKLVDLHGRLMLESVKAAEAQRNGWADECAKQGLATDQGMANARLAVKTFGGSEAMDALIQTGAAWHPAVQKFLQNIGSLLQEDSGADGKSRNQGSAADMMFPNSKYE